MNLHFCSTDLFDYVLANTTLLKLLFLLESDIASLPTFFFTIFFSLF